MDPNYELLPESLRAGARRYIEEGKPPGSFLRAVIHNNLRMAICRADSDNRAQLNDIVMFWHWEAPGNCWGSHDAFEAWVERGGQAGAEYFRLAESSPTAEGGPL